MKCKYKTGVMTKRITLRVPEELYDNIVRVSADTPPTFIRQVLFNWFHKKGYIK